MAERVRPNNDWYRRKILGMPDHDYLIGPPPDTEQRLRVDEARVSAFGAFVALQRRNRKLTAQQLATTVAVDEAEIHEIESNPTYKARPRTIVLLAQYFDVPSKEMMKLSGAAASN